LENIKGESCRRTRILEDGAIRPPLEVVDYKALAALRRELLGLLHDRGGARAGGVVAPGAGGGCETSNRMEQQRGRGKATCGRRRAGASAAKKSGCSGAG
ncbi:hypothetical protein B1218_33765, partial [Pseudomonas ogarae]